MSMAGSVAALSFATGAASDGSPMFSNQAEAATITAPPTNQSAS